MAMILSEYFVDSTGARRSCQRVVSDWRGPALPAADAVFSYLIGAIGHAFVQLTDSYCKVVMTYNSISDECLLRLFYDLNDLGEENARPALIVGDDGVIRRFNDPVSAADYVVARVKQYSLPVNRNYTRRRLAIAGRDRAPFHRLRKLCTEGGEPNFARLREFLSEEFANRYCIVQPDRDGNRLLLAGFGDGYEHLDEHWDKRRVGTPFGEFTDRDYSDFVKKAYLDAWRSRESTLEEIKSPRFEPPLPSKYERILLPIRLASGPALLSATLLGRRRSRRTVESQWPG